MTGIIGAMRVEAERLKNSLQGRRDETVSGVEYSMGRLCGQEVVVAVCGVGKVAAAVCAQTMILRYCVPLIVSTGVAGSLTPELEQLDAVSAAAAVQHDMDTSAVGDPVGMISGINLIELPCADAPSALLAACAREEGMKCLRGTISSGDKFIAERAEKETIVSRFGALACDMETAAVAHVCFLSGVDFGAIRVISDSFAGKAGLDYAEFRDAAAAKAADIIEAFLRRLP